MLDDLMNIDTTALLAVNGMHDAFQDALWWLVSVKWSSALLLVALLWVLMRQQRRHALLVLAMIALAVLLADQVASGIIKQLVQRLRPTHDPSLESMVHVINGYRGGMYGFVSSHAANSFAVSALIALIVRHRAVMISLFSWALLQCYSRVYLGVHYPGDILGGIVVGLLAAWAAWRLMRWIEHRWRLPRGQYSRTDAAVMASALVITVMVLVITAICQATM